MMSMDMISLRDGNLHPPQHIGDAPRPDSPHKTSSLCSELVAKQEEQIRTLMEENGQLLLKIQQRDDMSETRGGSDTAQLTPQASPARNPHTCASSERDETNSDYNNTDEYDEFFLYKQLRRDLDSTQERLTAMLAMIAELERTPETDQL
mmetsp:Transcript_118261/g.166243  ORF Transcript_118261/g.166243 Transcript_118261/m.166243 type:complete len:150 (-) Transcript_118261:43-492(-)